MAVYLTKGKQIVGGALVEYSKFSEKELAKAKSVLDKDPNYDSHGDGSAYLNGKRFIQLLGNKRVQVDEGLISDPVTLLLIEVMGIGYFEDITGETRPISELSKHSPSD